MSDPLLGDDLRIEEVASRRDCGDASVEAFCTQHWRVHVNPDKCDLDGRYTATMRGVCHPQAENCVEPSPNTMDVVMDVTSDDFCG